ncbi:MAG TPA: hypothetical protein VGH14_06510 [Solirubrobacterales bacterium]|jgi:hypothetical protein
MKIELLYFEGCPSYEGLLPEVRDLIAREVIGAELELRPVETIEAAQRERFLGSPTVRVDGADVEPGAAAREDFGIKCRLYRADTGLVHTPPMDWIRAAVRSARSSADGPG